MSTHSIGFYEDLTKIIFELSSNIIKYTPYFFCCLYDKNHCLRVRTDFECCLRGDTGTSFHQNL